ncbi:MAG: carbonic anhydrase [Bacteroidia bacterium]|nr:carbonic anhydrase [Bacteroidia bacterium]
MDDIYQRLLQGNKDFVASKLKLNPRFFQELAEGQSPPVFWVGCSDSRVPANEVTNTRPGEVFVHRNIANLVDHTDINLLSCLDFAVQVLKVKHVIVCGHYNCGGIRAALSNKRFGLIDNWLRNIKDVYRLYEKELDSIQDPQAREDRFAELNVIESVYNICKTTTLQEGWNRGQPLHVHGWIYNVSSGLIKDLNVTVRDNHEMSSIYKFRF